MSNYLQRASLWLALNKLSLNLDKTVHMTFGNYKDSVPQTLDVRLGRGGGAVKQVDNCKYLKTIFYSNMKWGKHIEYIINKTKYLIFVFTKLTKFMQTNTLLIYHALFQSYIYIILTIECSLSLTQSFALESLFKGCLA